MAVILNLLGCQEKDTMAQATKRSLHSPQRMPKQGNVGHMKEVHLRDQREVFFTVWEGNGKEIISFFGVGRKWEGKK